jgi:hypothetical protein
MFEQTEIDVELTHHEVAIAAVHAVCGTSSGFEPKEVGERAAIAYKAAREKLAESEKNQEVGG